MSIEYINLGTYPNDCTGDTLRTALAKCNDNFTYLQSSSGGGGGGVYNVSVNATLVSGNNDNLSPTGYVGGVTNRLILTPNAGGSNLLGITAPTDGWSIWIFNASASVPILLRNAASSNPNNQFQVPNNGSFSLAPRAGKFLVYVVNQWTMTT